MADAQFLNLPKSILISALLHVGLVVLCVGFAWTRTVPTPIGVEVMYGETTAPFTQSFAISQFKPTPQVEDKDQTDAPALKQKKAKTQASSAPQTKSLGSQQGASEQGALAGREGVANGVEALAEERYLYELKKLLEGRKRYPMMARKMGQTGKVTIRLTFSEGEFQGSEIVEKAPYETLNKAAQELVDSLAGFKAFPQELKNRTSWVITIPIEYSLN